MVLLGFHDRGSEHFPCSFKQQLKLKRTKLKIVTGWEQVLWLSNHLGNVMAVLSDRGVLQSAQDYFPFGMAMPGRSTGAYRYGFNGKETDTEMGGGIYTAEFWQYDARIGRRMNVDPVTFPWQSTYATFNNSPIALCDPSGAAAEEPTKKKDPNKLDEVVVSGKNEAPKMKPLTVGSVESLEKKQDGGGGKLKTTSVTATQSADARKDVHAIRTVTHSITIDDLKGKSVTTAISATINNKGDITPKWKLQSKLSPALSHQD
jgi:RHS repeat-associated protein